MRTERHNSEKTFLGDVGVPAQLLRATGNLGSTRDNRPSLAWEPQPALPQLTEGGHDIHPNGNTRPSVVGIQPRQADQDTTLSLPTILPSDAQDEKKPATEFSPPSPGTLLHFEQEIDRRFSPPHISLNCKNVSRPLSVDSAISAITNSSIWSNSDPFASSRDPSKLQVDSLSHLQDNRQDGNEAESVADSPPGDQDYTRRGTIGALVDALIPDSVQRRFTDASILRRSSIWQTYEKAKQRRLELQREKWAQVTFEYLIYAIIVLFVYFVLVGMPLWKGAVYWLWWVVAHKFVIAGGFSITLGIAFL